MPVVVFGAGIAGLTVCHELLEHGVEVTLIEKNANIGGFARTSRTAFDNLPSEHSWRGYAPFYDNFVDIATRIPTGPNTTVFDALSEPIEFLLPHDEITQRGLRPQPTIQDRITVGYHILKSLLADERRTVYAATNFSTLVDGKISKAGKDQYIQMLGPGLGLDPKKTSLHHVTKFVENSLTSSSHEHKRPDGTAYAHQSANWHVMTKPTSEAWFEPWLQYLLSIGLKLQLNTKLVAIDTNSAQQRVTACRVKTQDLESQIGAEDTEFVFCINPFSFREVLRVSGLESATPELRKCIRLVDEGPHKQISFVFAFDRQIRLAQKNQVFAFPNSEFIITLYPLDNFLEAGDPYFESDTRRHSLWGGTVTVAYVPSRISGKRAEQLSPEDLLDEIYVQIFRSKELIREIETHNTYKVSDLQLVRSAIWKEWKYDPDQQLLYSEPKWVNSLQTYPHRPLQDSGIANMRLGGAHTKVSTDVWSMEGGVESGKKVAQLILGSTVKVRIFDHSSPIYLRPFQLVDNWLYRSKLPNILDVLIILFVLCLVWLTMKFLVHKT